MKSLSKTMLRSELNHLARPYQASLNSGVEPPKRAFARVPDNVWAIVLAGGEGQRMSPRIRCWRGCALPKQYCAFVGTRSMLRHTVDRTSRVVSPNQIITVVAKDHLIHLRV